MKFTTAGSVAVLNRFSESEPVAVDALRWALEGAEARDIEPKDRQALRRACALRLQRANAGLTEWRFPPCGRLLPREERRRTDDERRQSRKDGSGVGSKQNRSQRKCVSQRSGASEAI